MSMVGAYHIDVDPATQAAAVILGGPPGPRGEQGPPGQGGAVIAYEYDQANPASSHVITHNLGYKPNVVVEEYTTLDDIMCEIIYHTDNQLELRFNTPRAIRARLS